MTRSRLASGNCDEASRLVRVFTPVPLLADGLVESFGPMRIRIVDPNLREELVLHFKRSGFAVTRDGDLVEIGQPDPPSSTQNRREIELHYAIWRAMNPDAAVELLDG